MEHTTRTYIGAAVVFVLSMAISYFAPLDEIFRGIAAMPAVGSITYALYQLVRDQAQYEKQVEIQRKQQFFSLGVTSHMASVVFDKHVGFCEAYLEEVDATVATLLQEGPTTEAMNHADNFSKIRRRYATWITSEISSPLIKFEASVRALGATQNLAEQTAGSERHVEQRDRAIDKADKIWIALLGELIDMNADADQEVAIEKIIRGVREILGIDELTKIRKWLISEAVTYIKN